MWLLDRAGRLPSCPSRAAESFFFSGALAALSLVRLGIIAVRAIPTPSHGFVAFFEVAQDGTVVWRMDVVTGADPIYRATPLASIAGERVVSPGPALAPLPR